MWEIRLFIHKNCVLSKTQEQRRTSPHVPYSGPLTQSSVWLDTSDAPCGLSKCLIVRILNVGRGGWFICFGARWFSSAPKWAELENGEKAGLNSYSNGNIEIWETFHFILNLILSFEIYCEGPRNAGSLKRKPGWKGALLALFSELAGIGGEATPLSVFIAQLAELAYLS